MVSFFLAFGFPIWYLNAVAIARVRIYLVTAQFFFLKIQETCTLTTFVEQRLSLCVKKLRNFMRVYVNWERAV